MWILPKNLKKSFPSAQECMGSREELKELLEHYGSETIQKMVKGKPENIRVSMLPLMWKSKPLSVSIWLSKWKEVFWIRHLFGATLKHSLHETFTEKYTESLEDILV